MHGIKQQYQNNFLKNYNALFLKNKYNSLKIYSIITKYWDIFGKIATKHLK